MKFNKGDKLPTKNPYDGESSESKVELGCDCELLPDDFGYSLRPINALESNECMIKGIDFCDIPYWARNINLFATPS